MRRCGSSVSAEPEQGFSLVELILVIVVLGILSAYAVMRSVSPREMTLPSQAQTMASDIRYAQSLATGLGLRVRMTFDAISYTATCLDSNRNPISCSGAFTVGLQNGAALQQPIAYPKLEFDSLGKPYDGEAATPLTSNALYVLTLAGSSKTISVAPLTGFVANP